MATRLSSAGAAALYTQTPTDPADTVSVIILDATGNLNHDRLGQNVATALPKLARFRSRLVDKPFGLGRPLWADIDDYDPRSHIHRATLPAPGGDRELAQLITRLGGAPHDWRRSLWEAWSVDGLENDRWALVVRMSPVLNDDGRGLATMWTYLLANEPNSANRVPEEAGLGSTPSLGELVTDTLSELVENQLTGAWMVTDAVTGLVLAARRRRQQTGAAPADVHAVSPKSGAVPVTVFNAPLTKRRSTAFASIPMADVNAVSDAFGGSAANVFLAACTLSLRAWLRRHAAIPDQPLVMAVPLSVPARKAAVTRKALAFGQIRIPVQVDDPVQVLTNLHTATERLNIANNGVDEKNYGQSIWLR